MIWYHWYIGLHAITSAVPGTSNHTQVDRIYIYSTNLKMKTDIFKNWVHVIQIDTFATDTAINLMRIVTIAVHATNHHIQSRQVSHYQGIGKSHP